MSSSFSDQKSQAFRNVTLQGYLDLFKSMSRDPEVNLNWQDQYGLTPFHYACQFNRVDMVRYLLGFHDDKKGPVDFNLVENKWHTTPFSTACFSGHEEVVLMLLEDGRVEVNQADRIGRTPLWQASFNGQLGVVRILLASVSEIDVWKKSTKDGTTAAEIVRKQVGGLQSWGSEAEFQRRKQRYLDVAFLIESYEKDPEGVKVRLRRELEMDIRMAGELFALVVYCSDGYLSIRPEKHGQKEHRFLSIAARLPMELQMMLCNRVFGVAHSIVKRIDSERGFKKFVEGF